MQRVCKSFCIFEKFSFAMVTAPLVDSPLAAVIRRLQRDDPPRVCKFSLSGLGILQVYDNFYQQNCETQLGKDKILHLSNSARSIRSKAAGPRVPSGPQRVPVRVIRSKSSRENVSGGVKRIFLNPCVRKKRNMLAPRGSKK